jgi:hypothetical protein
MSKRVFTYEVVGDYLKVTTTGERPASLDEHSVVFTYIKNGNINITGNIENPLRIAISGPIANSGAVINTSPFENGFPRKDINNYIPDLNGLMQNIFKVTGIQGVSGASRRKTYRRRH